MNNIDDFISIEDAAISTGITSRTIRYWISNGKVSCVSGKRGRLVRLRDIEDIKEITGRNSGRLDGHHRGNTSAGNVSGNTSGIDSDTSIVDPDNPPLDLTHFRDQFLAPLLEQFTLLDREKTALATEVGELRSDLRHERDHRQAIECDRDRLRQQLEELKQHVEKMSPSLTPSDEPPVVVRTIVDGQPSRHKRPSLLHRIFRGDYDPTGLPASR